MEIRPVVRKEACLIDENKLVAVTVKKLPATSLQLLRVHFDDQAWAECSNHLSGPEKGVVLPSVYVELDQVWRFKTVLEHELVHVLDVDNGARFETYTIAGAPGSGEIKVNGAAARLVHTGDTVIVVSYAEYDDSELDSYVPRVVHVTADDKGAGKHIRRLFCAHSSGAGAVAKFTLTAARAQGSGRR